MALKKSQLYASLWQSCDELRGGMDASQYKDYILTLLFMKYVSDKAAKNPDEGIDVPEGASFADMVALRNDKEIGEKINKIIEKLTEANEPLKGVIDEVDFNDDNKLGSDDEKQETLSNLIGIFNDLDFSGNRVEGDDLLGDAYEYLMRHFATQSGKSKGQFYTPAEVSRVIAKVIGINANTTGKHTIYDPTCGSGSLLLRAADVAPNGLSIYGQEKDNATYALAWMNMILHDNETAILKRGNTLASPDFTDDHGNLTRFDFAVANPPFSDKGWTSGVNLKNDPYSRFDGYDIPPAKNGDYAFLLHFIASLKNAGKGAIILPHGVLYRGNREENIRRKIINRGHIKGIIGLPTNLFYGTGIPACIIVIDKEDAKHRTGIFMIDASKGFMKDGNKNRLRAQDIHKIVSVFNNQTEIDGYSRMVPTTEITNTANNYNLNIRRYIDNSDPEITHDVDAHLNGGIPDTDIDAFNPYWGVFPTLRKELFIRNGRPGYSELKVETQLVKNTILSHCEFTAYQQRVTTIIDKWCNKHKPHLLGIDTNTFPGNIIRTLSEDLLIEFGDLSPLDKYDVYQELMNYWDDVMQDDVYLIRKHGWESGRTIREAYVKEDPDLKIKIGQKTIKYVGELIPASIIIATFFDDEKQKLDELEAEIEMLTQHKEAFEEEHGDGDGALVGLEGSRGKITKGNVQERVMEHREAILKKYPKETPQHIRANSIKKTTFDNSHWIQKNISYQDGLFKKPEIPFEYDEEGLFEELDVLYEYLQLLKAEKEKVDAHKQTLKNLYTSVIAKYAKLTEGEIKNLVVKHKWFGSIQSSIECATQRITQRFTEHVNELYKRYAQTLSELERQVEMCSNKVKKHLKKLTIIGHNEVTMESLLTGKTRLPGFSKEWETKRLGDIASFFKGSSLFKKTDMSLDGKLRCIHYGELFTIYGECITEVLHGTDRDKAFFCSVNNDVLMPASDVTPNGLATASCISKSDIILGGDILVIRVPAEILNGIFLAYTIKINRNQVMQLVTGTTVYHLYGRDMANFEFDLPSIQEQNAIVRVLSDMDAEITALEQRKHKTLAIKQGMMQQLLTGRV